MPRISAEAFSKTTPKLAVASLEVVEGPVGSGKTEALVQRAAAEAARSEVLVVCATRAAADDFLRRAASNCASGDHAARIRVSTARELAAEVLSEVDDRRALSAAESARMPGDLAKLAIRRDRLGQMLAFFERSWAELFDWNPSWLITHEERDLAAAVDAWQRGMGGRLASRLVPDALAALRADPALIDRHASPIVVVDDFTLLSRAEQVLLTTLCAGGIVVAGEPGRKCAIASEHPYPEGLGELVEQNPGCTRVRLESEWESPGVAGGPPEKLDAYERDRMRFRLLESMEEAGSAVRRDEILEFPTPAEEFDAAARQVAAWIGEGIPAGDILVAAAHPTWRANLKIAIEEVAGQKMQDLGTVDASIGNAVLICDPKEAWGLEPRACLVAGCMEGFLPARQVMETTVYPADIRERMLEVEVAAMESLKRHAKQFVASSTKELPLSAADQLGLIPARIVAREGGKVARLRRSCL